MKKTLTIAAIAATMGTLSASAQELIAGWDTWGNAPRDANYTLTDVTASLTGSDFSTEGGTNAGRGASNDGTWGSFVDTVNTVSTSTTSSADSRFRPNGTNGFMEFTITNNSGSDISFDKFHVDLLAWRPNSSTGFNLTVVSGGLTTGLAASGSLTHIGGVALTQDQHEEFDLDLTGLADNTLANTESVVFRFETTGGTGSGSGHHTFVDNIAFTAVPEPSTYALLGGLFALSFVAMRRRK